MNHHIPMLQSLSEGKRKETIIELITNITEMRVMVVQLENQILKLQIQIMKGESIIYELMDAPDKIIPISAIPLVANEPATELNISDCVEQCYKEIHEIFTSAEMIELVKKKYPEVKKESLRGIYGVLFCMAKKGRIKKTPSGYWQKQVK